MGRHCTNCGAQIPQGAHFCPRCGQAVSEGEEQAPRIPDQQQPPQQAVWLEATTPTQQHPSPGEGPGAPQQSAFQPPSPAAATAAAGGPASRRGCILAGVVAAALLGVLALVVVGGLALYFLGFARSGSSGELLSERPTPQQASGQGSLQDLVPQQVGDFTLESELKEYTGALKAGATQGVFMEYADPTGRGITHHLAFFSSPEAADQWLQKEVELFTGPEAPEEPWEKVEEVDLTDEQGQRIGTAVLLHGEVLGKPAELVLWTNDNLYARAVSFPERYAVEFFNAPPPY